MIKLRLVLRKKININTDAGNILVTGRGNTISLACSFGVLLFKFGYCCNMIPQNSPQQSHLRFPDISKVPLAFFSYLKRCPCRSIIEILWRALSARKLGKIARSQETIRCVHFNVIMYEYVSIAMHIIRDTLLVKCDIFVSIDILDTRFFSSQNTLW